MKWHDNTIFTYLYEEFAYIQSSFIQSLKSNLIFYSCHPPLVATSCRTDTDVSM